MSAASPPLALTITKRLVTRGFTPCFMRTFLPRGVAGAEVDGGMSSPSLAPSRVTTTTPLQIYIFNRTLLT